MKAYLPLILILLVVVGGIVWLFVNDSPPSIKNPKYAVGTITNFKQGQSSSGLDAIVTYLVEGESYESRIISTSNSVNVIGEKFKVVYEESNPKKCIVISLPVFTDVEFSFTKETRGVITVGVHKYNFSNSEYILNYGIEFEYEVNGEKFRKSQSLPKKHEDKYPNLKKGNSYVVKYWIENPKRAIIYLDKPVK